MSSKLTLAFLIAPIRHVVLRAKTSVSGFIGTVSHQTFFVKNNSLSTRGWRDLILRPVNYFFLSVISVYMIRIGSKFKIINIIVCLITVFMMNIFFWAKFSIQKLLHQISVILHALTINSDTKISVFRHMRFSPNLSFKRTCQIMSEPVTLAQWLWGLISDTAFTPNYTTNFHIINCIKKV